MSDGWIRVSHAEPCPVCQRVDWCTTNPVLGLILCMRVESSKPSKNAMGGWLHSMGEKPKSVPVGLPKSQPKSPVNFGRMLREWSLCTPIQAVSDLAFSIGVSDYALSCLDTACANPHRAWAFPMRDGHGEIVGIRLRSNDGKKWAVKGSKQGIFLPQVEPQPVAYICEGPTDTAAALTLGLYTIGRPSCFCGGPEIKVACKRLGVRKLVIVADNDEPGQRGAEKIAGELKLPYLIWTPPAKDLREFVRNGGTRQLIESELKNAIWKK